jgi:ribokinase
MGRVVVIGSINMDVVVTVDRMPRPGETLAGSSVRLTPGGKGANQAVAAGRLGAVTVLVGAVGADGFGAVLTDFLAAQGIDAARVRRADGPSGTAMITVAGGGENTVIVVAGANGLVTPDRAADAALRPGDVVTLQNEIPAETNEAAARLARSVGATTVLNLAPFRPPSPALLADVDVLIVNETEFAALTGTPPGGSAEPPAWLGDVVVTRGADGVWARLAGETRVVPARRVPVVDTTGAGDCFCGAFAAALAAGSTPWAAVDRAALAASIAVGRPGAAPAMPTTADLAALGAG